MKRAILFLLLLLFTGCVEQAEELTEIGNEHVKPIEIRKLIITSPAFKHDGIIPSQYTCDGDDINPPLEIVDIPEGTESLTLIFEDLDAFMSPWVHWVVWNIDPSNTIEEDSIPGREGTTNYRKQSYTGPCPPSREHNYVFTVYALDITLDLDSSATKEDVEKAMEGHILAKGELCGIYCENNRFSMDISPLKVNVERGETAEFQIQPTFCNPTFSKTPLRFYMSGLDPSMEWHVTGITLTIETSDKTPPGIYWFRLMGEAREYNTARYAALIVSEGPPQEFAHPSEGVVPEEFDSDTEDWPQLGANAQHTFFSNTQIPDHLEVLWQYQLEPLDEERSREGFCELFSPAIEEERVYILDFGRLHCVSLRTGRLLYEVPAYSAYPYTPTVVDGRVYIAAEYDLFRCVDAHTGKTLWERELPRLLMVNPIVDADAVYVTVDQTSEGGSCISPCFPKVTEWSTLVALNKETGEEIWRYSVADSSAVMRGAGFPTLAHGTILFYVNYYEKGSYYSPDPKKSSMVCLDADTGALKWNRESVLPYPPADVLGFNPFWMTYYKNKIYFGMWEHVMCIDVETQEPVWNKDIPGWGLLSVGNGVVVVRSWHQVDCLDAETGEELWTIPVKGFSMPVMTENEVFFESDDILYRADITSGKITESYYLEEFLCPPVVAHGHVLVAAFGNGIYCLGQPSSYNSVCVTVIIAAVLLIGVFLFGRVRSFVLFLF